MIAQSDAYRGWADANDPPAQQLEMCIFADDHDPPHFHVLGPGWSGVIDLDTLTLCRGAVPKRDFSEAVQWEENRQFLRSEWKRLNERD
jgi:hypothetical protein